MKVQHLLRHWRIKIKTFFFRVGEWANGNDEPVKLQAGKKNGRKKK